MNREEMRSKVDHRSRREAKTERRRDRVCRICPLGACALVDGVEVGDFAVTGGSGGSMTSASVIIRSGAWAGGKDRGLTAPKRLPG